MKNQISLRLNNKTKKIEMTAKFAKKASVYGTEEYAALQSVRRDYPNYLVDVIKVAKSTRDNHKGLDYKFMENYLKSYHGELLDEFLLFKEARDKDGKKSFSFFEMRDLFMEMCPEVSFDSKTRRDVKMGAALRASVA